MAAWMCAMLCLAACIDDDGKCPNCDDDTPTVQKRLTRVEVDETNRQAPEHTRTTTYRFEYDGEGRLAKCTETNGEGESRETAIAYAADGTVTVTGYDADETTLYRTDADGRATSCTTETADRRETQEYTYDADGDLQQNEQRLYLKNENDNWEEYPGRYVRMQYTASGGDLNLFSSFSYRYDPEGSEQQGSCRPGTVRNFATGADFLYATWLSGGTGALAGITGKRYAHLPTLLVLNETFEVRAEYDTDTDGCVTEARTTEIEHLYDEYEKTYRFYYETAQ